MKVDDVGYRVLYDDDGKEHDCTEKLNVCNLPQKFPQCWQEGELSRMMVQLVLLVCGFLKFLYKGSMFGL